MAITLLILIGFCWDFYGVYLLRGGITYGTGFWFDLLFKVTEVKVRQITETWHVSLFIEIGCWKLVWMCVLRPYTCVLNWSPFRLQTWLPGGHLEKHPFTSLSWSDRVMMLWLFTFVKDVMNDYWRHFQVNSSFKMAAWWRSLKMTILVMWPTNWGQIENPCDILCIIILTTHHENFVMIGAVVYANRRF